MKNISKITAFLLALIMLLSLAACGNEECTNHKDDNSDSKCDNCGAAVEPELKVGNRVGNLCYTYDFNLLMSDGTVNIEDYRGKVVVINFWGTWCPPCKAELPDFNRIAEDMQEDAVVIAVHSTNEGDEEPSEYVTEKFPDSKMIFARDVKMSGSFDKYYGLLGGNGYYPYTIIVDRDSVITYSDSGGLDYEQLKLLIEDAKGK